jgi:hypothetical protein
MTDALRGALRHVELTLNRMAIMVATRQDYPGGNRGGCAGYVTLAG